MAQHFTRNTVSVAFWCGKCQKHTQHRIDGGRKGPCLDCIEKLERQHAAELVAKGRELEQLSLFGGIA